MPKQKVDKAKFGEIKAYLSYHSVTDAVSKYKVCRNTIHQIKNHHSYDEWRAEINKKQREAFLARKAKVFKKGNGFNFTPPTKPIDGTSRTANGDPFGDAIKPTPTIPLGGQKAEEQDGPVVTVSKPNLGPMTYKQAYRDSQKEVETLKVKVAQLEMEKASLKAQVEEARKMVVVSAPTENAPTEIEITVGDATIKVSTKGKAWDSLA
mgnify:CR=1 FL=1